MGNEKFVNFLVNMMDERMDLHTSIEFEMTDYNNKGYNDELHLFVKEKFKDKVRYVLSINVDLLLDTHADKKFSDGIKGMKSISAALLNINDSSDYNLHLNIDENQDSKEIETELIEMSKTILLSRLYNILLGIYNMLKDPNRVRIGIKRKEYKEEFRDGFFGVKAKCIADLFEEDIEICVGNGIYIKDNLDDTDEEEIK